MLSLEIPQQWSHPGNVDLPCKHASTIDFASCIAATFPTNHRQNPASKFLIYPTIDSRGSMHTKGRDCQ